MLSFYVSLKFLLLGCIEQLGLPVSEQGYLLQCPYSFITEKFERIQSIKLNNDKSCFVCSNNKPQTVMLGPVHNCVL